MSYPLLTVYGFLDAPHRRPLVAAVFIMERIIMADGKSVRTEKEQWEKNAEQLSGSFGVSTGDFAQERKRQTELIRRSGIADQLLVRFTREALAVAEDEFTPDMKSDFLSACAYLAMSDELLHKRELMILYDLAAVCTDSIKELRVFFAEFQQACAGRFAAQHPVNVTLGEMLGLVKLTMPKARMALLQRPDENSEATIPPLALTYEEFADWITTVSFLRAAQHRQAPMNHTRTGYTLLNMNAQKGLIKLMSVADENDEQLTEAHAFTRQWCAAVRDNKGNFPFPDGQVFGVSIFGSNGDTLSDCCLPNNELPGIWHITCIKQAKTIEVHAFDISGDDPPTYWCPEAADRLAARLSIPQELVDGTYPMEEAGRMRILKKAIGAFKNV